MPRGKELSKMLEQWSEHIRELCGSIEALAVVLELYSGKATGE